MLHEKAWNAYPYCRTGESEPRESQWPSFMDHIWIFKKKCKNNDQTNLKLVIKPRQPHIAYTRVSVGAEHADGTC